MAVNFALRPAWDLDPRTEPMGRSWAGWDRTKSDEELWQSNRGRWRLDDRRLANERFATLSYWGVVQVVAEISGFELVSAAPKAGLKKALVGQVLHPGDPARDALVGRTTHRQRNPVGYLDTSDVDVMTAAQRGATPPARAGKAFLLTNNPARWAWDEEDYEEAVYETTAGRIVKGQWATGSRTGGIEPGDRAFLLRQGTAGRGIVGSGACMSRVFQDDHWDEDRTGETANYVLVEWDTLLEPHDALRIERLTAELPNQHWEPQASGTEVRPSVLPDLKQLWDQHLGIPNPRRTTPRQGWQLDAARRRKVEDAAQDRLMQHYEALGWAVKDTRFGNSFDAIAEKGAAICYLEAKGTETTGRSVIVSAGEVRHARAHPGQCVLGILSDVEFDRHGDVVQGSGEFRIYDWNPMDQELSARTYDFTSARTPVYVG